MKNSRKLLRNLWNQGAEALEDADDAVNDASDERATGGRGCGGNQQPGSCADAALRLWDLGNLQCTICIFRSVYKDFSGNLDLYFSGTPGVIADDHAKEICCTVSFQFCCRIYLQ